jgi:outer membrane protein with beta-barrel domain
MRRVIGLLLALVALFSSSAFAQEPPPRIGPFVVDLHASVPRFPNEDAQLAASRGLSLAQLPGSGLGVQVGAHVYFLRIKVITFGVGAEFAAGRASQTPEPTSTLAATEEQFRTFAPQLSFNFGNGHGWSYLSGGLGRSTWAIVPEGRPKGPADTESLKTLNYGGGARWFAKSHLAFSLDVRIYVISPGTPYFAGALGGPRTNLFVIGAGISVK